MVGQVKKSVDVFEVLRHRNTNVCLFERGGGGGEGNIFK